MNPVSTCLLTKARIPNSDGGFQVHHGGLCQLLIRCCPRDSWRTEIMPVPGGGVAEGETLVMSGLGHQHSR